MGKKKKKKRSKQQAVRPRPHGKSPISLCMIVKDEEKFLSGCLDSVRDLVGEMVVVDTGSSDTTIEIARNAGAKVFNYQWQNDFAAARNFALQQCTLPWILYLDADERLSSEFHAQVLQQVASGKADAYYLKVHSTVSGILGNVPHIQAYPRLFKKLSGARFEGRVHEQITPSLKKLKARFAYLDATIEHLGYAQEDSVLKDKIKRNLELLREQISKEPENAYACFQLGQTLLLDENFDEGKAALKKALDFRTLPNNLTSTALLMLANEHYKADEIQDALSYIEEAIRLAPRQRLGYFLLSECLAKQQKWSEALAALNKLQEYSDSPFSDISIEKNFDAYLVSQRAGLYHFNNSNYQQAQQHFSEYLLTAPIVRNGLLEKWAFAWQENGAEYSVANEVLNYFSDKLSRFEDEASAAKVLAGVAEKMEDPHWMELYLGCCLKVDPTDAAALYYLGNLYLAKDEPAKAENYYFRALEQHSEVWEVYYNLSVARIKQANFSGAATILKQASERFPEQLEKVQRLLLGLYAKMGKYEKVLENIKAVSGS